MSFIIKHYKKILGFTLILSSAFAIFLYFSPKSQNFCLKAYNKCQLLLLPLEISATQDNISPFYNNEGANTRQAYIAHGGGIRDFVYTNSIQAIEDSLAQGFIFVEIDFHISADGHLVGVHDWAEFEKFTSLPPGTAKKLTLNQLKKLKIKGKYTIATAADICRIMQQHPEMILVTDKTDEYELLLKEIPFPERIIVETFSDRSYQKALRSGIKHPAFNIYCEHGLYLSEKYRFPIVTIFAEMLYDPRYAQRLQHLHNEGVTILAFNSSYCDQDDFIKDKLGKSVSKIYTNIHSPKNLK